MLATDERLTTGQAARAAGVSEQTIRQWLKAGILQHEQPPLGRLIDPHDLDRVLQAREQAQRARIRPTTTLPGPGPAEVDALPTASSLPGRETA